MSLGSWLPLTKISEDPRECWPFFIGHTTLEPLLWDSPAFFLLPPESFSRLLSCFPALLHPVGGYSPSFKCSSPNGHKISDFTAFQVNSSPVDVASLMSLKCVSSIHSAVTCLKAVSAIFVFPAPNQDWQIRGTHSKIVAWLVAWRDEWEENSQARNLRVES